MKKIKLYVMMVIVLGVFGACDRPDVGFFSDEGIEMREDTMEVVRGIYQISAIPYVDGSTRPLTFEIVNVHNLSTGAEAPEWMNPDYDVAFWKSAYNGVEDTTVEQVQLKLVESKTTPVEINSYSGQLIFNSATANFDGGLYGVDVKASNSAGSKIIKNFCIARISATPFQVPGNHGDYFNGVLSDGTTTAIKNFNPYTAEEAEKVAKNTSEWRHLEKIGSSDIVELEVVVKGADDVVFPPKAIGKWWAGSAYYNNYEDNSLAIGGSPSKYTLTDTSKIYRFPTVPYPAFGSTYNTGDNIYLVYNQINVRYCNLTPTYQTMYASSGYTAYQICFKVSYKINEIGKWRMTIKTPYVTYNGL